MTFRQLTLPCALIAGLGIAALGAFTYTNPPSFAAIILALLLLFISVAAASTPIMGNVQRKVNPHTPEELLPRLAIREGVWAGLYVVLLVVLRIRDLFDPLAALVLLVIFLLVESFLQGREIPPQPPRQPRRRRPSPSAKKPGSTRTRKTSKRSAKS